MTREEVSKKVMEVYLDVVEEATGTRIEITEDSRLSREDGFDSLGIVDFFVNVEEECGVDLESSIADIRRAEKIGELVEIVFKKVAE